VCNDGSQDGPDHGGGAGFFGEILKNRLLAEGVRCVSIDLQQDQTVHSQLESVQGDIRDKAKFAELFARHRFDGVFHCAAILAHDVSDKEFLWTSNVDGTRVVAELSVEHQVPRVVFTSSNCLWADPFNRPVTEADEPHPREIYGSSKWEAEKVLQGFRDRLQVAIIRTPTIIDSGRLGLLAILFEFIAEGRRVWVVGGGSNRYQFVYAPTSPMPASGPCDRRRPASSTSARITCRRCTTRISTSSIGRRQGPASHHCPNGRLCR